MAVMVWIHGGAFAFGSTSHHPAGVLATFNDVIVVSINYRLGVLGFFNVPGLKPLCRAVHPSSPFYNGKVTEPKQLELFAKVINCSLGPDLVECVRGKTVEDILFGQSGITIFAGYTGSQDYNLPENLFKTGEFHADVDVITGVTSSEGAFSVTIIPFDQVKDGIKQEIFEFARQEWNDLCSKEEHQIIEGLGSVQVHQSCGS
ncbi:Cocaine esterase [Desmophyllum pertusum]|uniref:Cocaine esterase n=1 Tax=Desmophyllum pertusum TaxID=174260 RepID=A0A9X0D853_9CNID|nr:Cocaine esterase [Desmophyllum pertusum]